MHILCAFGCVYQMYNLNVIYFSYETTTNVRYETQTDTYLPAITVCYEKRHQIKDEFLDMFDGNSDKALRHLNSLTIQEQFNSMNDLPKILTECMVEVKSGYMGMSWIICPNVTKYIQYIDHYSYCFTAFPQLNGESDEKYQVTDNLFSASFLLRKFNTSDNHDLVAVYVHPRDYKFHQNNYKRVMVYDLNEPYTCLIKYNEIIIKYKFEPFGGCFEGQTRDVCISKCVVNEMIEKSNEYPLRYLTNNRNSSLRFGKSYFSVLNYSNPEPKCRQICGLKNECYKQYFVTNPLLFKRTGYVGNDEYFKMLIEYPTYPSTIYEISLKMSVEEYLCLMSSIFSLWFGFSILMFTDFCRLLFTKIHIYFQTFNINRIHNTTINVKTRPRSLDSTQR